MIPMNYPDIFTSPELVETSEPAHLCAQGLAAWATCMCGNPIPKTFGEVLVKVQLRLGMEKAATAEALSEHAHAMGWLNAKLSHEDSRR